MYYRSILIFLLLAFSNFYCHASPLPVIESNEQSKTTASPSTQSPSLPNSDHWVASPTLHEYEFLKMLCELYGDCNIDEDINNDEPTFGYHENKFKRLSPRLFYGIPKFG